MSKEKEKEKKLTAKVYLSSSSTIRKVKDDCDEMLRTLDSFRVKYSKMYADAKLRKFVANELQKADLPQLYVGDKFIGTCEDVVEFVEKEEFPLVMRQAGYADEILGGEDIAVGIQEIRNESASDDYDSDSDSDSEAPPPENDDDPPPPEDDDGDPPPPEDDDDEMPPPPE